MDVLKKIEMVARVCYKSEGKVKEGSAEKLVSGLIKRGHGAMLEHASFCFLMDLYTYRWFIDHIGDLENTTNFKSYLSISSYGRYVISGNVRAWREFFAACLSRYYNLPKFIEPFINCNPVLFPEFIEDVRFVYEYGTLTVLNDDQLTPQEKLKHQRMTVKFTVDRGISHEIVRHRPSSFGQESTRYCNYIKDDFGGEIAVIKPFFLEEGTDGWNHWKTGCEEAEKAYFNLLNWGCTAQEARIVLPTGLKTEIVMTATLSEWVHFFNLRALGTTGAPHPQIKEVALPLLKESIQLLPEVFGDLEVSKNV